MILSLIILLVVSHSWIDAIPSVSFFYPKTFDESTCQDQYSWTNWFNSAHPKSDTDFDQEVVAIIQQINGRDMCISPQGVQARSVSPLIIDVPYLVAWRTVNGSVAAFVARTPGVDFQVRFCCYNYDFITTTSTTARPISDSTCGRPQIQPILKQHRIFGGSHAMPHSWPWVRVNYRL
jgi:hypothetical protein